MILGHSEVLQRECLREGEKGSERRGQREGVRQVLKTGQETALLTPLVGSRCKDNETKDEVSWRGPAVAKSWFSYNIVKTCTHCIINSCVTTCTPDIQCSDSQTVGDMVHFHKQS